MLSFHNLDRLSLHHDYLKSILGQKGFFFVGGMIRDLLLNKETNLDDVDITLSGSPKDIKTIIHSSKVSDFSFFDTEKYGTMTIIPKEVKEKDSSIVAKDNAIKTMSPSKL